MSDLVIAPARRIHAPLRVHTTGLHRGGERSLAAVGQLAKRSLRPFEMVGIDPVPGRASEYRDAAKKHGLVVDPIEARYEAVAEDPGLGRPDLHLLHADDAGTHAFAIERAAQRGHGVTGLMIANLPVLGLTAFRYAAVGEPGDPSFDIARRVMGGLAHVSSGLGSGRFWGPSASLATRQTEPRLRAWFNDHLDRDVGRLLGGLRPTALSPIEATSNGQQTRPVVVLDSDVLDDDSSSVARRVEEAATFPLRRRQAFLVVEIAREPEPVMRFRHGVIRDDHLLQVGGAQDVSRADMQRQAELARGELELRRNPTGGIGSLLSGLALGFALGAAIMGVATRGSVDMTD